MKSGWIMLHTHEVTGSNPVRPTSEIKASGESVPGAFFVCTAFFTHI